jgi:hypothetical protein
MLSSVGGVARRSYTDVVNNGNHPGRMFRKYRFSTTLTGTNLAGGWDMASLTLADLIREVPLTSREAATLTLAVGGEWERQRLLHGPVSLPATAAISLHSDGQVRFLIVPPATSHDDASALSALFGELLGIERPRHQAWRGHRGQELLATADRPAPLDLSSSSLDSFRAALLRFADDDPDTLPALFRRAARAMQTVDDDGTNVGSPFRRGAERRHAPETVAELRRTIRGFEQQIFEGQARAGSPMRLQPSVVAAAAALLVLVGLGLTSVSGRSDIRRSQAEQTQPPVPPTGAAAGPAAASAPPPQAPFILRPVKAPAKASPPVAPVRATSTSRHRRRADQPSRTPAVAAFPGGTRTITWMSRTH